MRRASIIVISLFATCLLTKAQTLQFGVQLNSALQLEPEVQLKRLELGDSRLDLRLAGGATGPLELGVRARETESFGPLGNLVFYASLDLSAAGVQTAFGAEGVVASVAGEVELGLTTLTPGSFSLDEIYGLDAAPFFGMETAARAYLDVGASYRLNRTLIVSVRPELSYIEDKGLDLFLGGDMRLVKRVGPDDLYFNLQGRFGALDANFGAFGVRYDVNRRTLPNLKAALWLGLNAEGALPGGTLELSQRFSDIGAEYTLTLAAEPYRTEVLPYRASLGYEQQLGPGELLGSFYGTLENGFGAPLLGINLAYAFIL